MQQGDRRQRNNAPANTAPTSFSATIGAEGRAGASSKMFPLVQLESSDDIAN
jgi:hypothetical protein